MMRLTILMAVFINTRRHKYYIVCHDGLDPVSSVCLDIACASEDNGACALACPLGYQGIRRNDGLAASRRE
jgi:hypothetical protein